MDDFRTAATVFQMQVVAADGRPLVVFTYEHDKVVARYDPADLDEAALIFVKQVENLHYMGQEASTRLGIIGDPIPTAAPRSAGMDTP